MRGRNFLKRKLSSPHSIFKELYKMIYIFYKKVRSTKILLVKRTYFTLCYRRAQYVTPQKTFLRKVFWRYLFFKKGNKNS